MFITRHCWRGVSFIQSDLQCIQYIHLVVSMSVPWELKPQRNALPLAHRNGLISFLFKKTLYHRIYILTHLATFWINLMVQLEDVASAAPRAWGLTLRRSVASLCVFCAVSGREEAAHSAGHTAAELSVKQYKTAFPSTCHLLTVWNYKYEHSLSVNIMHFR